jgi:hypothetical protein
MPVALVTVFLKHINIPLWVVTLPVLHTPLSSGGLVPLGLIHTSVLQLNKKQNTHSCIGPAVKALSSVWQGANIFKAKVNIEVQWASEPVIAAIERNGGVITTAYYDVHSLWAAINPEKFFQKGKWQQWTITRLYTIQLSLSS